MQVGTQTVWSELDKAETPRIVVVGRLDRENADFDRVLEQLREAYGIRVTERVPLTPRPNDHNLTYLRTKRDRMGHVLPGLSGDMASAVDGGL